MKESQSGIESKKRHQQVIVVTAHTIVHPCLERFVVKYAQDIPRFVCNIFQAWKSLQRYPRGLTDSDHDYILDKILPK